jgi:hypothetical protein
MLSRLAELDRPPRSGRFFSDACQRVFARPVVRQFLAGFENGAIDLAKAPAFVDYCGA